MPKTLYNQRWYRPREVAELGLIKNSVNSDNPDSNYYFIIKLINSGQLKAKDYGRGERPYYLISEREIERYHKGE